MKFLLFIILFMIPSYSFAYTLSPIPADNSIVGNVVHVNTCWDANLYAYVECTKSLLVSSYVQSITYTSGQYSDFNKFISSLYYPPNDLVYDPGDGWLVFQVSEMSSDKTWTTGEYFFNASEVNTPSSVFPSTLESMRQSFDLSNGTNGSTIDSTVINQSISFIVGSFTSIAFILGTKRFI